MPKKRTTKAKAANISKPKENVPNKLTEEEEREKKEQLELILKEFDNKAKVYQKAIDKQRVQWLAFLSRRYLELKQAISEIGTMTITEFSEAGGTFDKAQAYLKDKKNTSAMDKMAAMQNLMRLPRGLPNVIEEDGEDDFDRSETQTTVKSKRIMSVMPSSSKVGRKPKRAGAITPLNTLNRNQWGQTPLITPKFNPNLPQTPDNSRRPKRGERLMSITGSPVSVPDLADISPGGMERIMEIIQQYK